MHVVLGRRDGLERVGAEGQVGGDGRRQRAAGAVVVAGRDPVGLEQDDGPGRARHDVGGRARPVPAPARCQVAALHHHGAGAEGPELLGRRHHGVDGPELLDGRPVRTAASRRLGVATSAPGEQQGAVGVDAVVVDEPVAGRGDEHRVDDEVSGRPRPASAATAATVAPVASIPVLTAAGARSSTTASTWATTKAGSRTTTPVTARVFCAVTAVTALVPKTPWAAKVLRSACRPAPPPESEPAMLSATTGVTAAAAPAGRAARRGRYAGS